MRLTAARLGAAARLAGLIAGLSGLLLQFVITIPASLDAGRSLAGAVAHFFSFFTILTNIAVVAVYLAAGSKQLGRPSFFASPRTRAGVAVAITVVFVVYVAVLAPLWQPRGWFLLCDIILHYAALALYLAWWGLVGADGSTRKSDLALWLGYPLAYLAYVMARYPLAGEMPYPFLDPARGMVAVATSVAGMLALFIATSAVILLTDRWLVPIRSARRDEIARN